MNKEKKSKQPLRHHVTAAPRRFWATVTSTKTVTAIFIYIVGLLAIMTAQMFYPYDRALPFARVKGTTVGFVQREQLIETLRRDFGAVPVTVTMQGNETPLRLTSAEVGITPDYAAAADAVSRYDTLERFIPFSLVYRSFTASQQEIPFDVEKERYDAFRQRLQGACRSQPRDAGLSFSGGTVSLEKAVPGRQCTDAAIYTAVTSTALQRSGMRIDVAAEPVEPARTDDDLRAQFNDAKATIAAGLTVASETGEQWPIPADVLAGWLTVAETDGRLELALKQDAVKTYLSETVRGSLYIEPDVTRVSYRDGVEVGRETGRSGRGVDVGITTERISAILLEPARTDRTAWVAITTLEPRVENTRTYTATNAGMQALVEQWDRDYPARYGVMVRDLSGRGLSAELHPDRDFVTASTFKMFLAYAVLHKSEQGQLDLSAKVKSGLSAKACLEEMILHSTNQCALDLFELAGWSYVHNFIKGQFPGTTLDNNVRSDGEKHTTPRDATAFMTRLHNGELMSRGNTDYLLGLFKRQVWRSGIPRGVPGITVANKVGFYNGWKHDTGIVYGKRGAYILTVYTKGGNDAQIAELSRRVAGLMNQ